MALDRRQQENLHELVMIKLGGRHDDGRSYTAEEMAELDESITALRDQEDD